MAGPGHSEPAPCGLVQWAPGLCWADGWLAGPLSPAVGEPSAVMETTGLQWNACPSPALTVDLPEDRLPGRWGPAIPSPSPRASLFTE